MIILADGPAGSGKTILITHLLFEEWKRGLDMAANYDLFFRDYVKDQENYPEIIRWHRLDEVYNMSNCAIAVDDGQILFDARRWQSLPPSFAEKVAAHRHHHVDIYTTTQDFLHIDARIRSNVHVRFSCRSIVRIPKDEKQKPIFQICKVTKKIRVPNQDETRILWTVDKKFKFYISRYWTKTLYNTYSSLDLDRYLCKIIIKKRPGQKKEEYIIKMYNRHLVNAGKARL